jgi:hypothetical protein
VSSATFLAITADSSQASQGQPNEQEIRDDTLTEYTLETSSTESTIFVTGCGS